MIRLSLAAYLDSLSTFATVALTFLLMIALLRLARWLLEVWCASRYAVWQITDHPVQRIDIVYGSDWADPSEPRVDTPPTDAEAPPTLPAVAGGEHSGARLGDENGYLGTGLR